MVVPRSTWGGKPQRFCSKKCSTAARLQRVRSTPEGLAAHNAYMRSKQPEYSDRQHRGNVAKRYGVAKDWYDKKLEEQGGVCAICFKPETVVHKSGKTRRLTVDHNHETNEVRDLLCSACNFIVGLAVEDHTILDKAALYVLRWSK